MWNQNVLVHTLLQQENPHLVGTPRSLEVLGSHSLPAGFPGGASGKESACQCRRHKRLGFGPWVGKIPRRGAWQPPLIFLPGKIPWTEEPGRP